MTKRSLWQHAHPRPDGEPAPAAERRYDLIVVGAGLTGLTTAVLAARHGREVLVLEAREVGAGASGSSTAKVSLLQGTTLSALADRQPAETVSAYVRANREAQEWLIDHCRTRGVGLQRRPAITYATTDRGLRVARREFEAAAAAGLGVEWSEELGLPFPTRGGVVLADQAQLDPMELLVDLRAELEERGGVLGESVRVRGVRGRSPVRVRTDVGDFHASTVVIATNMPILDRGGFFARATASRSYGLSFDAPGHGVEAMYLSAEAPARSLRDAPTADGNLLLVGGNGHTTGRADSPQQLIDALIHWTTQHFPGARLTHAWSAQDWTPTSGVPFVGPILPGQREILVAGGYAKWGMTNAVAAAHSLTALMIGRPAPGSLWPNTWRPPRPSALISSARTNAAVGVELAQGWVRPLRPGSPPLPQEGAGTVRYDGPGPPTAVSRVGGEVRRLQAVCTHLGGVVAWNDAEHSWDCPLHGSRFAPDGTVLDAPASCGLRRHRPPTGGDDEPVV